MQQRFFLLRNSPTRILPSSFFYYLNLPWPLTNWLKKIQFWSRIPGVIKIFQSSWGMIPLQVNLPAGIPWRINLPRVSYPPLPPGESIKNLDIIPW